MKKTALLIVASIISFLLTSCDMIDGVETRTFDFSIENTSPNLWEDVIVYAKDGNGSLVDSSYRTGYLAGNRSVLTIEIPKIQHIEGGLFEIQATAPNGKLIVHEFGHIDKPKKEKEYHIELQDSTIVFR